MLPSKMGIILKDALDYVVGVGLCLWGGGVAVGV